MHNILANIAAIPHLHMWFTFAMVVISMAMFISDKLTLEVSSIISLAALMLFFYLFPLPGVSVDEILSGFSNPALISVMSLLVLGQAVVRTGSLNGITGFILRMCRHNRFLSINVTILLIVLISSFVNDTPTCVVFIPIMMAVAKQLNLSASKVMIPVSYACILGGTTTLIGSSTNLLVNASIMSIGLPSMGFFDFTVPGVLIASLGFLYMMFIMPFLLPSRAPLADDVMGDTNRQFVAQLELGMASALIGQKPGLASIFASEEAVLKMLQRGEHAYLPPFDNDLVIEPYDILIVSGTRSAITELFTKHPEIMARKISGLRGVTFDMESTANVSDASLSEVIVAPASRMIGQSIEQIGFHYNYHCIVLGIQRRSRVITSRMTDIRLAAGDVLLVLGSAGDIGALRRSKDVVMMDWATEDLSSRKYARWVNVTFLAVIASAALDIVPIYISAFIGVAVIIVSGCMNLRQAKRALESSIIMMVAVGIALGIALQATGGAAYLADKIVNAMQGTNPVFIMSAMFGLIAISTNFLSNHATSLLFTPIMVSTAHKLGVPPAMFIHAVIFASNCCDFATPIGFQTNLLVMAPGHYKFSDYIKAGLPLMILVWATYTIFSYYHYGYR